MKGGLRTPLRGDRRPWAVLIILLKMLAISLTKYAASHICCTTVIIWLIGYKYAEWFGDICLFLIDLRPSVNYTFTVSGVNLLGSSGTVNVTTTTRGMSVDIFKLT